MLRGRQSGAHVARNHERFGVIGRQPSSGALLSSATALYSLGDEISGGSTPPNYLNKLGAIEFMSKRRAASLTP
jgi:hypothetical protein